MPKKPQEIWTDDLRKQWAETWDLPHMRIGRSLLLEMTRVKGAPIALANGCDAQVLSSQSFHFHQGQSSVLDFVEWLADERKERIALKPEDEFTPPEYRTPKSEK